MASAEWMGASFYSKWTFSIPNGMLSVLDDKKAIFTQENLMQISKRDYAKCLMNELKLSYVNAVDMGFLPRMMCALFHSCALDCVYVVTFTIFESCIRIALPIALIYLLQALENSSSAAYYWATAISVLSILLTFVHHALFFFSMRLGWNWKNACISLVYDGLFAMSDSTLNNPANGLGTGMLVNLISNDASRLEEFAVMGCYCWESILEAGVVLVVLIFFLDVPSAFAGVGSTFLFIPALIYCGKRFAYYRNQTAQTTDSRVRHVSEIIDGIATVKSYVWEKPFIELIGKFRSKEESFIERSQILRAINQGIIFYIPSVSAFATFAVYSSQGGRLNIPVVFATLSLLQVLRMAMGRSWTRGIETVSEAVTSCARLDAFFKLVYKDQAPSLLNPSNEPAEQSGLESANRQYDLLPESDGDIVAVLPDVDPDLLLSMKNCSFQYGSSDLKPALSNINMSLMRGELLMVIGPVGCGKSTLLLAVLNEVEVARSRKNEPSKYVREGVKFAYCAQKPWIIADSVRANITVAGCVERKETEDYFNSRSWVDRNIDLDLYSLALESCLIVDDLQKWPSYDSTELGERGISISGGQKARISLARAIYSDADLYLLDDPLSAVDAHVGAGLFAQGIVNALKNRGKGVILVTHQLQYIEHADKILLLDRDGNQSFFGSYEQFQNSDLAGATREGSSQSPSRTTTSHTVTGGQPFDLQTSEKHISASISAKNGVLASSKSRETEENHSDQADSHREIIAAEDRAIGSIPLSLYFDYFSLGGVLKGFVVAIVLISSQVVSMITDYWPKWWASSQYGDQSDSMYILVFGLLAFGCIVMGLLRAVLWFRYALAAASNMHEACLWAVVHTPLRFFVANPTGRILNRFAKDQNQVDEMLPITMFVVWDVGLLVVSSVILVCITFWYMTFLLPTLFYLFVRLRSRFLRTSREIKRLEAVTRSPIYSDFSATLDGLITLRAYRLQNTASRRFQHHVDLNGRAWFSFLMCSRWLGFRLDLLSNLFLVFVAYLAAILGSGANLGLIGFALVYSINLAGVMQWMVRQSAEAETQMTSVERIKAYSDLQPEEGYSTAGGSLQRHPDAGAIVSGHDKNDSLGRGHLVIDNLTVSYRADLKPVLRGLSLDIAAGSKVGICGRTGSGKSTLLSSLLRLNLINSGDILVDGKSILHNCDLETARSIIAVIPQEPHLFSGSVRFNVDPFSVYSDQEIWSALTDAHIDAHVRNMGGLELGIIEEGGKNLSVGQRQLLSLARAILRGCSIVLMDEVTASIDFETDSLIQTTIRTSPALSKATILTVAHRLRTIADSNLVVVLAGGEVIETGNPKLLLEKEGSAFRSLAERSGEFADIYEIASRKG